MKISEQLTVGEVAGHPVRSVHGDAGLTHSPFPDDHYDRYGPAGGIFLSWADQVPVYLRDMFGPSGEVVAMSMGSAEMRRPCPLYRLNTGIALRGRIEGGVPALRISNALLLQPLAGL